MENIIFWAADAAETAANLILIFAAVQWIRGWRWITFTFAHNGTCTVRMRAKDLNTQTLTNAVSTGFFGGGQVPANVRAQIISFTSPTAHTTAPFTAE